MYATDSSDSEESVKKFFVSRNNLSNQVKTKNEGGPPNLEMSKN